MCLRGERGTPIMYTALLRRHLEMHTAVMRALL
jgi:hypothetical protein